MPDDISTFAFKVVSNHHAVPGVGRLQGFLIEDRWDDWGSYQTQFYLKIYDFSGTLHDIGEVKIGRLGMTGAPAGPNLGPDRRRPNIPSAFIELDERTFSLGQDDTYYEALNGLGDEMRNHVLLSLRDVAANNELWLAAKSEDVMETSLLRSVKPLTVEGQFRAMTAGAARLTKYEFVFHPPVDDDELSPVGELHFKVDPKKRPSTNVHVLIGRNGVGKTRLLNQMVNSLLPQPLISNRAGSFSSINSFGLEPLFANVVFVSFSAFDQSGYFPESDDETVGLRYSYIGLKARTDDAGAGCVHKTPDELADEFAVSMSECLTSGRRRRWDRAIEVLTSDPVFAAKDVGSWVAGGLQGEERRAALRQRFHDLSSGHKIVLLTITRLVHKVEERSLVLMDEPEGHLHPPLLAALVKALSELLTDCNGVAIVATHSPVVLHEVPKSCVWYLRNSGNQAIFERPEIETFGENVGVLTRDVFQLEVVHSGFHKLLRSLAETESTFEEAFDQIGGQLGAEGRAALKILFILKGRAAGGESC